jgi:hypothetical protein
MQWRKLVRSGADGHCRLLSAPDNAAMQRTAWESMGSFGLPAVAALRAHPGFEAAAREAAQGFIDLYQGNFLLNRILNDRGRFVLSLLAIDLHFQADLAGAHGGLTAARLKAAARSLDVCSPGRVVAFLAMLRLLRLVVPGPAKDRRLRPLIASERFVEMHRLRWRCGLAALAPMLPEARLAVERIDDDRFLGIFVRALAEPFKAGWRLLEGAQILSVFAERDAGMVVALALVVARQDVGPSPLADLARRFHVSRAHVLETLRAAEQKGLVRRSEPRGGFLAEPPLVDALHDFLGAVFVTQAHAARVALAAEASSLRPGVP